MTIDEIMSGPHEKQWADIGQSYPVVIVEPLRPVPLPNRAGAAAQGWNIRLEQWQRKRRTS